MKAHGGCSESQVGLVDLRIFAPVSRGVAARGRHGRYRSRRRGARARAIRARPARRRNTATRGVQACGADRTPAGTRPAQAERRLVEQQQAQERAIRPRAIASICCSPPDKRAPRLACAARAASEQIAYTSSSAARQRLRAFGVMAPRCRLSSTERVAERPIGPRAPAIRRAPLDAAMRGQFVTSSP